MITLHAIGFIFPQGRIPISDPEEYHDFAGKSFNLEDARPMLERGIFPVGLILQAEEAGRRGPMGVIVRDGNGQAVELLEKTT